jgi:hypothetical protein
VVTGTGLWPYAQFYTGIAVNALTPVGSYQNIDTYVRRAYANVTQGTNYKIKISNSSSTAVGVITFETQYAQANDNFAEATTITGETPSVSGDTSGISYEVDEPIPDDVEDPGYSIGSLWYKWTAPKDGTFMLSVPADNIVPVVAVYTGTAVNSLTEITHNTEIWNWINFVQFDVTEGTSYKIQIIDWYDDGSTFDLSGAYVPANDLFANALLIDEEEFSDIQGDNSLCTIEAGEDTAFHEYRTMWFEWVAPSSGHFAIDTLGSEIDTRLGIYTGASISSLTIVSENDDNIYLETWDGTSRCVFEVEEGISYKICVSSYDETGGIFYLSGGYVVLPTVSTEVDEHAKILLHFDGPNGGSNFTDSSSYENEIIANGVTISTSNYQFGGASAYFGGDRGNLQTSNSGIFGLGTSPFTIEFRAKFSDVMLEQIVLSVWEDEDNCGFKVYVRQGRLWFVISEDGVGASYAIQFPRLLYPGIFYNFVIQRTDADILEFFVNGIKEYATSFPYSIFSSTAPLVFGSSIRNTPFVDSSGVLIYCIGKTNADYYYYSSNGGQTYICDYNSGEGGLPWDIRRSLFKCGTLDYHGEEILSATLKNLRLYSALDFFQLGDYLQITSCSIEVELTDWDTFGTEHAEIDTVYCTDPASPFDPYFYDVTLDPSVISDWFYVGQYMGSDVYNIDLGLKMALSDYYNTGNTQGNITALKFYTPWVSGRSVLFEITYYPNKSLGKNGGAWLEEVRIDDRARFTEDFNPPIGPYGFAPSDIQPTII